jgi:hypothetical protein
MLPGVGRAETRKSDNQALLRRACRPFPSRTAGTPILLIALDPLCPLIVQRKIRA